MVQDTSLSYFLLFLGGAVGLPGWVLKTYPKALRTHILRLFKAQRPCYVGLLDVLGLF